MSYIVKGSDRIIKADLQLDDISKEIDSELTGLKVYLYDSCNTLIDKFSWPAASGFTTIVLDASKMALIYLVGTKTINSATGSVR